MLEVSTVENSYQKAAGIWERTFFFSLEARNMLAFPLELEQSQFLIGFKISNGTFLQSSMNRPHPVEAE